MYYMIADVLKVLADIGPKQVKANVSKQKPLLRNQKGCDDILEYLKDLEIANWSFYELLIIKLIFDFS